MRSLYLVESDRLRRVAAEGRALRVEEEGRAAWYIPAARVERAVLWGSVPVDTEALGLLLDRNVPVAFVARGGRLRGIAWSARPGASRAQVWLARRRQDPDWVAAYRNLLASWTREARLALVRRADPAVFARWSRSGFRGADWQRWRRTYLAPAGPEGAVDAVWRYLKSLVWEAVTGWSLAEGLDPHQGILDPRERFGFTKEMARPLVPWIDGEVRRGGESGVLARSVREDEDGFALTPAGVRHWTARFEGQLAWMDQDVRQRIGRVVRLALEWQPDVGPRPPRPAERRARLCEGSTS